MKILFTTLIIASAAGAAMAQQEPAAKAPAEAAKIYAEAAQTYTQQAKVVAELAAAQGFGSMKNSPLSADEVNESVQTLADGNRIVRNSTSKFYRNSEGRIRREGSTSMGGVFGTTFSVGQGVSITSPVLGQKYMLDTELKTARVLELGEGKKLTIAGTSPGSRIVEGRAIDPRALTEARVVEGRQAQELVAKLGTELKTVAPMAVQPITGTAVVSGMYMVPGTEKAGVKYETNTEELGQRDFEGVMAEGTRRTTIIPAGAIGNDRPIEVVYERWYSKEIGMVVYSKNTDPRSGEQTYKLTNIVRSEPDPSLFAVPAEYKKVSENGTIYKVGVPVNVSKAPTAAKTVMVASPAKAGKP